MRTLCLLRILEGKLPFVSGQRVRAGKRGGGERQVSEMQVTYRPELVAPDLEELEVA
jgi:hypothetical protein